MNGITTSTKLTNLMMYLFNEADTLPEYPRERKLHLRSHGHAVGKEYEFAILHSSVKLSIKIYCTSVKIMHKTISTGCEDE